MMSNQVKHNITGGKSDFGFEQSQDQSPHTQSPAKPTEVQEFNTVDDLFDDAPKPKVDLKKPSISKPVVKAKPQDMVQEDLFKNVSFSQKDKDLLNYSQNDYAMMGVLGKRSDGEQESTIL